jgi:cytochrome c
MFRFVIVTLSSVTFMVFLFSWSLAQDKERQSADVASGQMAFNNACRTCHSVKEGEIA